MYHNIRDEKGRFVKAEDALAIEREKLEGMTPWDCSKVWYVEYDWGYFPICGHTYCPMCGQKVK
jgi:hypothetical protein